MVHGAPPAYDLSLKKPMWKIQRSNTEGLFPFDAELNKYRSWKNRIRDHASEELPFWRTVLDDATSTTMPITKELLQTMDFSSVNGEQLSNDLWSFLLRWIGPNLYQRRTKLSQGIEGNGLELWRKLFTEYEGSGELLAPAGRTKLHSFPQIRDMRSLDAHLDEWLDLWTKYGDDAGPSTAIAMFLRVLPDTLRTEIHRRPELKRMALTKTH